MGPAPVESSGLPPKQRKVKTYQVLGDVGEFQERLASTLPPPTKAPPPNVFTIQDTSGFPPDVWFAATISPDNGVAVIASFKELCKARSLYQQQLTNIHTARKQYGMGASATLAPLTLAPLTGPGVAIAGEPPVNRTIAETLRMGAETRKLGKFDLQQQKWDEVTATLATRVGRQPQELAMQRGPAWRTRAELTELIYRAQPRDARGLNPDEAFLTSLRDAWERVIPLGTIFSGLALHIKDKPHEMPDTRAARVGRPLEAGSSPALMASTALQYKQQQAALTATGALGRPPVGRSLSARGRAWEDSEVLQQRVTEYDKRLKALAPHDPDFGSLVVAGEALEGQLAALATAPISLAEVEAHLRSSDPGAYEAYRAVKDEMEAQLRAALEAEEAQRQAAEAAARALAPQPGPHVSASCRFLALSCHTGETEHGRVTLVSTGTAAVWWRWECRQAPQPQHAATEVAQPKRFIASQQSGTLLPGQSLELSITFVASAAGTFRESWELVTRPPLQGPAPSLTLLLRGSAEVRDQSATGRAAVDARLVQSEKMAKVAAALERVLRDVRMPRRPVPTEPPEEAEAADAWDRTNGCNVDGGPYAWPPLFYSASLQSELAEVYREANAALTAALTPPVEEDPKKKRKDTAERHRKKPVEEAPPPPPKYPPAWAASNLTVLDALLAELAAVAPAVAAPLVARGEAAKARARVPPSGRKLLRRAMRSLVCKMVEGVEDKLNTIRADLEAKAAAEAAAAAADGADGEAIEQEPSSGSVATVQGKGGKSAGGAAAAAAKGGHGSGKAGAAAGAKPRGSHGHGSTGDGSATAGVPAGGQAAGVEHLQPVFHEKAITGTKAVIKASLNSLLDEVLRHKLAVGDALEGNIRTLDEQISAEAEQQQQAQGEQASVTAVDWFAAPSGGVPAPGPGPAATVRSPGLEQLYWDRLCVLRTWTSLGIPNRADIR